MIKCMIQPTVLSNVRDITLTKLNGNSKVVCTAIRTTLGNKRYFCPNNNTENY